MNPLYESEKPGRGSVLPLYQRFYHLAVLIATDDAQQYAQSYSILTKGKRTYFGLKAGLRLFKIIKQDEITKPRWIYPELYKSEEKKCLCVVCGKPAKWSKIYCSRECRRIDWGVSLPVKHKPIKTPHYEDKPCKRCGKYFTPRSNRALWCDKCRPIAQAEYKKNVANPRDKERQRELRAQIIKKIVCVHCGKEFVSNHWGAKYCSAKCHREVDAAQKRAAYALLKKKSLSVRTGNIDSV